MTRRRRYTIDDVRRAARAARAARNAGDLDSAVRLETHIAREYGSEAAALFEAIYTACAYAPRQQEVR